MTPEYVIYHLSQPHCSEAVQVKHGQQLLHKRDSKGYIIKLEKVVHDGVKWTCKHSR